ncbi:hypothetical protein [Enterobacillus tribolii]|uniref:Uncharacterized protein n=1 Tax=Enterobacillus tribolii TaxID=1487935 RepID=A0A370Q9T3_9GAMM|nr:hypothetical protein [Enterobacillus tribolii]MBW7984472.1 hypothetical protein [Enterobacillus tribolii]RDK85146.1 hypothetical protein C8D90_11272 [Enterobacillus tribolii]
MYKILFACFIALFGGLACAAEFSAVDLSREFARDPDAFSEQYQYENDFTLHGVFRALDDTASGKVVLMLGLPSAELTEEYDPRGIIQLNPDPAGNRRFLGFEMGDRITAHCSSLDTTIGFLMFRGCTFSFTE